jgi:hypothetical protein
MSFLAFDRHGAYVEHALSRFGASPILDVRSCVRLLCVGTVVFWCPWVDGPLRVSAPARGDAGSDLVVRGFHLFCLRLPLSPCFLLVGKLWGACVEGVPFLRFYLHNAAVGHACLPRGALFL